MEGRNSELLEVQGRRMKKKSIFDKDREGNTETNTRCDSQGNIMNGKIPCTVGAYVTGVHFVTEWNNGFGNPEVRIRNEKRRLDKAGI